MKLINYFGNEFEREKPLTKEDLQNKKDIMVIYITMGSKDRINTMLETLTAEEARLIGASASTEYIVAKMQGL